MKQRLFVFLFSLLSFSFLLADTITETVYSDPALDGEIKFSQSTQSCSINSWMYDMYAGDTDQTVSNPDPNSLLRSFMTFYLPEIPVNYHVDSVYIRIYQYSSWGFDNQIGDYTNFPVWDVTGGDTIKCILSHIDYGNELDAGDWEKGDIGNPYTYQNNVGTVTESGEDGYRYVDVTNSVIEDYGLNRNLTQYRISFQIGTDWDNGGDLIGFKTANSAVSYHQPRLYIQYTDEISSNENNEIPNNRKLTVNINPNPAINNFSISFSRKDFLSERLEIFNIKGQKVKSINCSESSNNGMSVNCSNMPSGIYFLKVSSGKEVAVRKFLIMK
ncbi:MAG TPA: T9SS type A sorting domain-containing protein [Candidatus Cloacimonadota bacterium]|nr:T9SS type A sorting domain-containing protein [Candidatus Cloacimonadota bacterium]